MIIGSKLEPGFGPVVMLGMGGIYVEVLKDVTFKLFFTCITCIFRN